MILGHYMYEIDGTFQGLLSKFNDIEKLYETIKISNIILPRYITNNNRSVQTMNLISWFNIFFWEIFCLIVEKISIAKGKAEEEEEENSIFFS